MTATQHTPGPWTIGIAEEDDASWFEIRGPLDPDLWMTVIASVDFQSDAHLISAAPDLLALCEVVHGSFGGGRVVTFSDDDIAAFAAAIAKAKGGAA